MARLENELIAVKKEDKYIGKILAELRRSWVTDPSKVDEENFVPKWEFRSAESKEEAYDWRVSKTAWLVGAGLDPKNPKAGRKVIKTNKPDGKPTTQKVKPEATPKPRPRARKAFLTKEARLLQAREGRANA